MQEVYDWTQFHDRLKERGSSMQKWCDAHGFNKNTVSALRCGRYIHFCNYGAVAKQIIDQAIKDDLIAPAESMSVRHMSAV